ncbi:hypothetical protein BV22DRAFT_1032729 [Leucogyrophana mollusca]|uniref:Uncharacterized protein n=1 Tax=Leucogyrophana mollusca TaxID=85980 RepID=A0ACB8BM66_9AGAM|nr:hypothetical protein BV22DRAFT_1032729 [Leucogyrophana mollusca]
MPKDGMATASHLQKWLTLSDEKTLCDVKESLSIKSISVVIVKSGTSDADGPLNSTDILRTSDVNLAASLVTTTTPSHLQTGGGLNRHDSQNTVTGSLKSRSSGPRPPSFAQRATLPSRPPSPAPSIPVGPDPPSGPRVRSDTVGRLTRDLWDTRREISAFQAREQAILIELGKLGARPKSPATERKADVIGELEALLKQSEDEVRLEHERRQQAEKLLKEVERECRAPFVVPALLQAFLSITELAG